MRYPGKADLTENECRRQYPDLSWDMIQCHYSWRSSFTVAGPRATQIPPSVGMFSKRFAKSLRGKGGGFVCGVGTDFLFEGFRFAWVRS